MNKKLIGFLKKRNKIILNFNSKITLKKTSIINNRNEDVSLENNKNGFEMILKISTETLSPLQRDSYFGNWDEIIGRDCFDEALQSELFCFLDHKMDIKNTLASTRNNSMTFKKGENCYIAKIQLDETIEQHRDLIQKVKNGIVNTNSFIFIPKEVEYSEHIEARGPDDSEVTVTHKKGELISVDPVILAFYPTNEIEYYENKEVNMDQVELKEKNKIELREESKDESDDIKKEDNDETKAKEDSEKDDKEESAIEADKADKEEGEASKDKEKKEAPKIKFFKNGAKVEIEYDGVSEEELEATLNKLLDAKKTEADNNELEDTAKAETSEADKSMDGEEINSEKESKRTQQILKNNEVIKKMDDILKSNKPNEISGAQIRSIALKKSQDNWSKKLSDEMATHFIQRINNFMITSEEAIDEDSLCKSINLCSASLNVRNFEELKTMLTRQAIDGSSYSTGLAYISIINDPEVKTELERTLPEIKGADFIQLDSLDIVQKDLQIPSSTAITAIKEGAVSTPFNGSTVSIKFNPTRYALEHQVNIKLPNFSQVMEKETHNGKNGIVTSLRNAFYKNLVLHRAVTYASLAPEGYLGGITKDALIGSSLTTGLSIPDLDNLINTLESIYGVEEVKDKFVFLMHPNTRSFIFTTLRKEFNAVWVANDTMNTFRGINIVTAPMFPGAVNPITGGATAGTLAFILCRKDTIAVRGFNFVIEDNPFIDMSKGLATRYQNTRGEMKLYDPFLNSYGLQIGVVTTFTVEKVLAMGDEEIKNIIEDNELFKSQTKEVRKALEAKEEAIIKEAKSK